MALLDILYRDEDLIAINKPDALLVHRTRLSGERLAAVQILRDQINRSVYPVHRLDRATSGVLVFGLHPEAAAALGRAFAERLVRKRYRAIVRGRPPQTGVVDHPVADPEDGIPRTAISRYQRLETMRLEVEIEKRPAVYSLIEIEPETGRRHQIRRHLKHIHHPIIGDTQHGRGAHNRYFREHYDVHRLLLHARSLALPHPGTGAWLQIEVDETEERSWRRFRAHTAALWHPDGPVCVPVPDASIGVGIESETNCPGRRTGCA
jgi:tRNA pseudouridine65 synthase